MARNGLPFIDELSEGTAVRVWTLLVVALEALSKLLLLGTLFALFVAPEDPVKVASLTAGAAALVATARTLAKGELLRRANLELGGAVPQRVPHAGTQGKTIWFFFILTNQ